MISIMIFVALNSSILVFVVVLVLCHSTERALDVRATNM